MCHESGLDLFIKWIQSWSAASPVFQENWVCHHSPGSSQSDKKWEMLDHSSPSQVTVPANKRRLNLPSLSHKTFSFVKIEKSALSINHRHQWLGHWWLDTFPAWSGLRLSLVMTYWMTTRNMPSFSLKMWSMIRGRGLFYKTTFQCPVLRNFPLCVKVKNRLGSKKKSFWERGAVCASPLMSWNVGCC